MSLVEETDPFTCFQWLHFYSLKLDRFHALPYSIRVASPDIFWVTPPFVVANFCP